MEIKLNNNNNNKIGVRKLIPQMLIKDSLNKTKRFFNKSFKYINSVLFEGQQKPPETANPPLFTSTEKLSSKLTSTYTIIPEKAVLKGIQKKQGCPKERSKRDEQRINAGSVSFSNCRGLRLKDHITSKEERNNASKRKQQLGEDDDLSSLAFEALAQKMRELEMMDLKDVNHVLDVEEVLHYYSRLNCPAYLEIIEKFFMDMYLEYRLPQPSSTSRSGSMMKVGSISSSHGSMRKVGSISSAHGSMGKVGSNSVHGSMRSLGPLKL